MDALESSVGVVGERKALETVLKESIRMERTANSLFIGCFMFICWGRSSHFYNFIDLC